MTKLYANENFPVETVHILRKLGFDILTTHEVGKSNLKIPDEEVLAYSISEKRAIITVNRKDFTVQIQAIPASSFAPKTTILKTSLNVSTKCFFSTEKTFPTN